MYIFREDYSYAASLDNGNLYVDKHKNTICIAVRNEMNKDGRNTFMGIPMATYKSYDDCIKVMKYLRKRMDLGIESFVFPSQKYVDKLNTKGDFIKDSNVQRNRKRTN